MKKKKSHTCVCMYQSHIRWVILFHFHDETHTTDTSDAKNLRIQKGKKIVINAGIIKLFIAVINVLLLLFFHDDENFVQ